MFVLKGVLLGLGLFGICLVIYIVGMTRFLTKGTPAPAPGTTIGIDFVTMLRHNHWALVVLLRLLARGRRVSRRSPIVLLSPTTAVDSVGL